LLGASFTLVAGPGAASAQPGSACAEQRLRVEGTLSPQWLEPVVKLCESLGALADVDRSAELRVVGAGDDVIVEVTLGDGRSTLRRVRVPSDLPLTVEALVTVLPPSPASAHDDPQPAPAPIVPQHAVAPLPKHSEPAQGTPAPRVEIELGGGAQGRVSGRPGYVSLGASGYAGLRVGVWLLALTARWDGFQTVLDERPKYFEMTTAGGGCLLLRRLIERPGVALEGGLSTWMLGETQAYEEGEAERAGSVVDVRIGLLARVLFGSGPLRLTTSLDGELSPTRLTRPQRIAPGLPTLPSWSLGLGAGIAWEGP
jgi:hypothetical protein